MHTQFTFESYVYVIVVERCYELCVCSNWYTTNACVWPWNNCGTLWTVHETKKETYEIQCNYFTPSGELTIEEQNFLTEDTWKWFLENLMELNTFQVNVKFSTHVVCDRDCSRTRMQFFASKLYISYDLCVAPIIF